MTAQFRKFSFSSGSAAILQTAVAGTSLRIPEILPDSPEQVSRSYLPLVGRDRLPAFFICDIKGDSDLQTAQGWRLPEVQFPAQFLHQTFDD